MSKSLTFKGIVKDYDSYLNDRNKAEQEEPNKQPEKKHKFTEKAREENKNNTSRSGKIIGS